MKNSEEYSTKVNSPSRHKPLIRKILIIGGIVLFIGLVSVIYYRYYFVFGQGVKAGQLNYFVEKGYLFKTHEGRLIQSGFRTQQPGAITSNEFMFSVTDSRLADSLNHHAGSMLELHYKEYLHTLPWRGVSHFVVDSIYAVKPGTNP
ncbi:hypothetical protein LJ707_17665 [Mucilaginibacter sp. UR6-1]|uniref:hypothetical protein n=1 Tax=Mucilaginibacter sp. UR6-1 TaxID=1435643 RepID=UPI001E540261|nr:hypothetical protein [Mucilaginibacter sp. UR6-1]MCC8410774.1 hypothetical protein [Mucilaginibacter sp. UR6-1]